MKYKVNEIFASIQGEGLCIGVPMNFIRLCRCNLECSWCDTDYKTGAEMSVADIIGRLDKMIPWVSLTGGEPMLEEGLLPLIHELQKKGFKTFLETNGTLFDQSVFSSCDYISLDLKPPSSGTKRYSREALSYCLKNPGTTQVKVVIQDLIDVDFFRKVRGRKECMEYPNWVLQPEWGSMGEMDFLKIGREFPSVRIIPQMHKVLGVR